MDVYDPFVFVQDEPARTAPVVLVDLFIQTPHFIADQFAVVGNDPVELHSCAHGFFMTAEGVKTGIRKSFG